VQRLTTNGDGINVPIELPPSWFIWTPAPVAARHALDEFAVSRHKRTQHSHVFVCPHLMTAYWRKTLHKFADLVMEIPAGARSFWPLTHHEPLLIGLAFALLPFPPWILQQHPSLLDLGGQLRSLWATSGTDERPLLRQLCALPTTLARLS
jgi:hypothetical protein